MARTQEDSAGGPSASQHGGKNLIIQADGKGDISLPDSAFVTDADILRDGQDLILKTADGQTVTIEGYFSAEPPPLLHGPDGHALTPGLVDSFVRHEGPAHYASAGAMSDESPIGAIREASGNATITRGDGTKEAISIGTPVYKGDIIETDGEGAVDIVFIDETSLAVSQNAKLAIDEYVFDPSSESGTTDLSVLRGLFVFTSGLIGREDPDDVHIETPMGSIGIRGTIIAGNLNTGEITVMEGAIVLRSFNGTEITLSEQFETARFNAATGEVSYVGKADSAAFSETYGSLKSVTPSFFSGIDNSGDNNGDTNQEGSDDAREGEDSPQETQDSGSDSQNQQDGATPEDMGGDEISGTESLEAPATQDSGVYFDTTFGATDSSFSTTDSYFDTSAGSESASYGSGSYDSLLPGTDLSFSTTDSSFDTAAEPPPGDSTGSSDTAPPPSSTTSPPPVILNAPPTASNGVIGNILQSGGYTRHFTNDSAGSFGVAGFFSDPDGDTLSFSMTNTPPAGLNAVFAGGVLSFNIDNAFLSIAGADQTETINITATDPYGQTATASFTLTVLAPDVLGTTGVDSITTTAVGQVIAGFDGNDTIDLNWASGTAFGGLGNDTINIYTGSVGNEIYGGAGIDTVTYIGHTGLTGLTVTLDSAGATLLTHNLGTDILWEIENITGSIGNDTITGDSGANTINGDAGNDLINGGAGDDALLGGTGDDTFMAAYNDGNDTIDGGTGTNDSYNASAMTQNIDVNIAAGQVLTLANTDSFINLETFVTGSGNDTFIIGGAALGTAYSFSGGSGTDKLDATAFTGSLTINATTGAVFDGTTTATASGIEEFMGGSGADTFTGSAGNDLFRGNGGNDTFVGSAGTDIFDGGTNTGAGDTVNYSAGTSGVTVDLNNAGFQSIGGGFGSNQLLGIENVTGTAYNDVFKGTSGNNTFTGGGGTDTVDYAASANAISVILDNTGNGTATGAGTDTLSGIEKIIASGESDTVSIGTDATFVDGAAKGAGTGDTLAFSNAGTFNLTSGNVQNIEIIDAVASGSAQVLNVTISTALMGNDTNFLTIKIAANDTLNLNLTPVGYTLTAGDLDTGGGATFAEFTNGGNTVRIEYGTGATLSITGAPISPLGLNLNAIGGADGFKITNNTGDGFGFGAFLLGDVNDDGFSDIGFTKQNNAMNNGEAFTLTGQAAAYATDTLSNFISGTKISSDTGLFNIGSSQTGDLEISGGGDFNGDGIMDYIVGAPLADSGANAGSGNAQIINGATGAVMATLDGMGFLDNTGKSVSFIGDINNDGFSDVLIGASGANSNTGAAYILFGDSYGSPMTFDVASLGRPQFESSVGLGASAVDIESSHTLAGDTAFVLLSNNTVKMYDMDDPAAPVAMGSLIDNAFLTGLGVPNTPMSNGVSDIMVKGPYMYILTGNNGATAGQIAVVDVNDPGAVTLVDSFSSTDITNATAMDVSAQGKMIVVTNNGAQGNLSWIDVAPNGNILAIHGTSIISNSALSGAKDVAIMGDYAYVVSGAAGSQIRVVDLTGANPVLGVSLAMTGAESVFVDHETGMMYVTGGGSLKMFDLVSDPSGLTTAWTFSDGSLSTATDITVEHGIAYITNSSGVIMIDVHNPGSPVFMNNINAGISTDDNAVAVTIGGDGQLYIASGSTTNNLSAYDLEPEGFVINGAAANDLAGANVASAGDFNGDGYADFMMSIPGTNTVALILGGELNMMNLNLSSPATYIQISGIVDADNDIPVFNAGDFDGDGLTDIAVADDNAIHIFFSDPLAAPGDTRNTASADVTIAAAAGYEMIGSGAAGDFNADGFSDFAVAMRSTITGHENEVSIYVVYGGITGTFDNAGAATGLNDSANAFLMSYQIPTGGANNAAAFRFEITSGGDLNGDGFADLVLGTPDLDSDINGTTDGEAIIVYGSDTLGITHGGTATSNYDFLVGTSGIDALNDGGFSSVSFYAGAGNDVVNVSDADFDGFLDDFFNIDGGGGFDTLYLAPGSAILDLTNVGSEIFKNMEGIDLSAAGTHTLVLGLDDLFGMMQGSPTEFAKITGDATDIFAIELPDFDFSSGILNDNDWMSFNSGEGFLHDFGIRANAGDASFEAFSFGGYQLWISDAMLNAGNVVIGQNIVTDNSLEDNNVLTGQVEASANEQTLIGSNGANAFHDGSFDDVAMFGFGGNDTFALTGGNFDIVNGGTGLDLVSIEADIDFRTFNAHELSSIEKFVINSGGLGNMLTLSKQNILDLLASSDDLTLTIDSTNPTMDTLKIDNMTVGGETVGAGTGAIATALGATLAGNDGTNYLFDFGGGQMLKIDMALVSNTQVDII